MFGAPTLESLAHAQFGELTEAELKLVLAAPVGDFAICGPLPSLDYQAYDPAYDPAKADADWKKDRTIRAAMIRWICVNRQAKELVDPKGINILGARILDAIDLANVAVPHSLKFSHCLLSNGIDLRSSDIPELNLQGTWSTSIFADRIVVLRAVFLRHNCYFKGTVTFSGAQIGGNLECTGSKFYNPGGQAFNAQSAEINGTVFLGDGFDANGEVNLKDAKIEGDLDCIGGSFRNPRQRGAVRVDPALTADGIRVGRAVLLRDDFYAEGEVRLLRATIGLSLECRAASFINPAVHGIDGTGEALDADEITVGQDVLLQRGFRCQGNVDFLGAHIDGDLTCTQAKITGAFIAQRAIVKGAIWWAAMVDSGDTELNLIDASASTLYDDELSWPPQGNLELNGFLYQRISGGPTSAESRLEWLGRQRSFNPQPYRQLARILEEAGDESGRTAVLVEMESQLRAEHGSRGPLNWVTKEAFGYGYYPSQGALLGVGFMWALGWIIYRRAYIGGAIVPKDQRAYQEFRNNRGVPLPNYPRFSPAIYSVENSLPLVKLGQADRWQPDPNKIPVLREQLLRRLRRRLRIAQSIEYWSRKFRCFRKLLTSTRFCKWSFLRSTASPVFLQRFLWLQIILGWVLATLFAAGLVGLIKH